MNILAGVLLFIGCTYLGMGIEGIYRSKLVFLKDLHGFFDYTESEILHLRTALNEIIKKYAASYDNKLSKALIQIKDVSAVSPEDIKINYLSQTDKRLLCDFLYGITQISNESSSGFINSHKHVLAKHILQMEEEHRTKGKLAKKIAPVLGLGLMIIVL